MYIYINICIIQKPENAGLQTKKRECRVAPHVRDAWLQLREELMSTTSHHLQSDAAQFTLDGGVCVCVRVCACICVCVCDVHIVCVYIYVCTHAYKYVCIYTYTHSYMFVYI